MHKLASAALAGCAVAATVSPLAPTTAAHATGGLAAGVTIAGASTHAPASALAVCDQMVMPVRQVNSTSSNRTLLTTSVSEASQASGFNQNLGTPFNVATKPGNGLTGIYRLYNAKTRDFVWLPAGSEMNTAIKSLGYKSQGVAFYAATTSNGCDAPVYRLTKSSTHQYTSSSTIRAAMLKQGWSESTAAFYADTKPVEAIDPLYTDYVPAMGEYATTKDPALRDADYQIGATPTATWISGPQDNTRLQGVINKAAAQHQVPQITLYGIPDRDCGGDSAGGLKTPADYRAWIDQVSRIIGNHEAMVIVEPDAISYCSSNSVRATRGPLLAYVGSKFKSSNQHSSLYLHVGSGEFTQANALDRAKAAGIQNYRGFAMNVASHGSTNSQQVWAEAFVTTLTNAGMPNMHYVVDTSRNGVSNPPGNVNATFNSCNNMSAALGQRPSSYTTGDHADAYLWIKHPGVSDGKCGTGGLPAGSWSAAAAKALVANGEKVGSIKELS